CVNTRCERVTNDMAAPDLGSIDEDMSQPDAAADVSVDIVVPCVGPQSCPVATLPICDDNTKQCRGCAVTGDGGLSSECPGSTPHCAHNGPSAGACLGCLANADCVSANKTCGATGSCEACTANDQCTSGLCTTGTCVSPSTLLYVNGSLPTCSEAGSGSFD